ncbi:DUF1987 domain-containing protein [Paenibacillus flagellatus]|uniref:SiaC family regulatory phosphoprotein domain-containing protein n=1 Tax=Paenibacillus flagellatus TaxID=2211139 RepID=A0A2V5JYJ8_9BACL|nr:DUF1987 domain-containing protein [Paenibacillus flagellatus]PYI51965.1 hypothetical protein DLM86_23680 [Paenibacillus flagellatus]
MERLHIAGTKSSPAVDFDPVANRLSLNGQSYPENAFKFYEPILDWADAYLRQLAPDATTVVELRMPYINTSSTKCLMMLLDKFEVAHAEGKAVFIRWYCNPGNETEFECAEELKEDLTLPFDIVAQEESSP